MNRPILTAIAAAALALAACSDATAPDRSRAEYEALLESPALVLSAARDSAFAAAYAPYRFYGGFVARGGRVARRADTWSGIFDTLQRGRLPARAPIAVDFASEMVVVALHGQAGSGGHLVRIRHVTLARDTIFVLADRVAPGATCVTTAALTQPTDARVLASRAEPVVFHFAPFVRNCETGQEQPAW